MLGAAFFFIIHTQQYKLIIKLHVNGLDANYGDIKSVTTCQTRFKKCTIGVNGWKIVYF